MKAPLGVEIDAVTHRFRATEALTEVSATIRPGTITGLVGRNGAGKTTLLSLIAALRPLQSGTVRVGGRHVWEDPDVTSRICLVRERGGVLEEQRIRDPCGSTVLCAPAGTRGMPSSCSTASGCR